MLGALLRRWFGTGAAPGPALSAVPAPDANAAFAAGLAAFHAGQYAAAVARFRIVHGARPADLVGIYHLASALAAAGDLNAAAPLAARVFEAEPGNPDHAACLRFITVNIGLQGAPGEDPFWAAIARGNRLLDGGHFDAALAEYRSAQEEAPASAVGFDRIGVALCNLERFTAADESLRAAARLGWPLHHMVDLRASRLEACVTGQGWRDYQAALAPRAQRGAAGATLLLGCDGAYFKSFVPALVNSLTRNAGLALRLHIHLLDADASCDALRAQLPARGDIEIEISIGPDDYSAANRRLAYACTRFLLVPALLARDGLPVLVLDADLLVLRPLAPLFETLAPADFAIPLGGAGHREPAEMLWASLVWFAPTPAGQALARLAANYIADTIAAGRAEWFIDQIALLAAYVHGRADAATRVALLPTALLDSSEAPGAAADAADPLHACFWALANSVAHHAERTRHPLYRAYSGA